uniref:Variable surface protein vir 27 n=2 Tax=Plasmodium vivax TaxID=5855 RepID=I6P634_PLAVI|nr:variable surface protein vir 27 [Plasmodium vivax]AFD10441.1 variable surface protein vir 27 [Plasmodium vivax]
MIYCKCFSIYCVYYLYFLVSQKENIEKLTSRINCSHLERGQRGCNHVSFYTEIRDELQNRYQMNPNLCDKIYPKVQDMKVFSKIINMIYEELYRTDMYTTCKPLHQNIDENTFKKYKSLFDYSIDYQHIHLNTLNPDTTCDEHYRRVIDEYINTYENVHSSCKVINEKKYDCDKIFSLFGNKKHKDLISLRCKKLETQTFSSDKEGERAQNGHLLNRIGSSNGVSDPADHLHTGRNPGRLDHSHRYLSHASTAPYDLDTTSSLPTDGTAEGGSKKNIMGSVVPVLGISSISLLLYKVTPARGFINKLLRRNGNMYNPVEYMDAFNPYSDGIIPGDRRMNISYHRL